MHKIHEIMTRFGFRASRPKRPPSILTPEERAEIGRMYQEWLESSPHAPLLAESLYLQLYSRLKFEQLAAESKRFREQLEQLKALGASIGGDDA